MASIALFHSVYGLRPAEGLIADRFRAAGHTVVTPDLFDGASTEDLAEGFAILERTGWATVLDRARRALRDLPADTVLAGISMGGGVLGDLLAERRDTAGILVLHGLLSLPERVRPGLPAEVHVADPDRFAPPGEVRAWRGQAERAGLSATIFTYPGAGHYYTDPGLPDHDERAAELTLRRCVEFLARLRPAG